MNTAKKLKGRILLIDPSEKGGLPRYTAMIAEALVQADMRPVVLAHRLLALSEPDASWPVHRWLPAARWPRPADARAASKWEQAAIWAGCAATIISAALLLRPQIIHYQYPIHPRFDALLLKVLSWIAPVVLTAHDVIPHDPRRHAEQRARAMYRTVDLVLVHSAPAGHEIEKLANIKPVVVEHPALRPEPMLNQAVARKRLGLDANERVACAAGFIRAYKGFSLLADVWERLGNDAPVLLILGQLVDQSEKVYIDRLMVLSRTDIRLGYANDDDLAAACAAADVVLLPYEWGSDSGILHLARALGTPVMASEMPQLAAVVTATSAGRVLARDTDLWAEALRGTMPPAPPLPPSMLMTGQAHAAAYEQARRSWLNRSKKILSANH